MIKEIMLISALTFTPLPKEVEVIEEPVVQHEITKEEIMEWISEFLGNYFSAETVTTILSCLTLCIALLKAVWDVAKKKKSISMTAQDVKDAVLKEMGDKVSEEVKAVTAEAIDNLATAVIANNDLQKTIVKAIALMQDGTPEGRLAALECFEQSAKNDINVVQATQKAKETIKVIEKEKENKKEETLKEIEKMKSEQPNADDGTSI